MNSEYYDLHLTPLSPIHMGTGEEYEPTNYVIDNGILFEFDSLQAMTALSPQQRKELANIMAGVADTDTLRKIQSFFYRHKDRIKSVARRHVKVNDTIEQFYQSRIGKVAQHESRGKKVQNKLAIGRTAWNPQTQINYIPGSGLKGAMRTALLDACNKSQKNDPVQQRKKRNKRLQSDLFNGSFSTDPLRLLSVSDAMATQKQVMTEIVFELNKKKKPVRNKNGQLIDSSADKGLKIQSETLSPFQPRVFKSQIELKKIQTAGKGTPSRQFDLAQIAKACNQFFLPILKKEIELLKNRGFIDSDWKNAIQQVIHSTEVKDNRAFILRVGRHSGAESLTLNDVRWIKIMQGKGKKAKYQSETTTMWLANDHQQNQRDLLPFGWLLIEVNDKDATPNQFPFFDQSEEYQLWYQQLDKKLTHLKEQISQERRKEQEHEQQKQQAKKEQQQRE